MISGEEQTIQDAISGDASAFGLLYDRYQPQIYRFIYLKVGHREEAEDITHQVFLNAWQNIYRYKFQGFPFSSWLYQIARNQVIDNYRTKKPNVSFEDAEQFLGTDDSFSESIEKDLEMDRIRLAIKKLPHEYQDVIIMRFIEDLNPDEVAAAMKKSSAAVRVMQHRAMKHLKSILETKDKKP